MTSSYQRLSSPLSLDASHEAFERTKRSVGGGVSSGMRAATKPHPLFVNRAAGAHVWDLDGAEFIDYVMAWGPSIVGHSHPHVVEAVMEVIPRMQMVGMGHTLEYEAAELVLEAVPGAERLLWTNSGTEAVQIALRLARAGTGRSKVLKFTRSYHGWHDSVYASMGADHTAEKAMRSTAGQSLNAIRDLVVTEYNSISEAERILGEARERDIAAVLIDPIMSNAGLIPPAPGYLERLRELCDEHGVVLIFDQVIAGFRIARGGVTERYGVTPDLSTFGKAIAGGFSQSAVVGKAALIDQVQHGVSHAGTYNGNPVALAAVKATQEILAEPGVYDRLEDVSAYFQSGVQSVFDRLPYRPTSRRVGSFATFVPQSDGAAVAAPADIWDRITAGTLARGVAFLPTGKIFLSTEHTRADVDRTVDVLGEVVDGLVGNASSL
ncbi:aspartate aminotransferase family protein [Nocardia sp. NBC_00565]|uniref:aspartate aminotransferase family protein n=1 Tax=Nocardia sp. NBC_00565 TaxID=2975993 RepID=UPI002E820CA6|nr:aspartate aminotransferase family protein [Nocardia sp. NBC_00565]WUC06344.1 aspartate aminotransferase family protein [Nocardia sp. NBC_00565]